MEREGRIGIPPGGAFEIANSWGINPTVAALIAQEGGIPKKGPGRYSALNALERKEQPGETELRNQKLRPNRQRQSKNLRRLTGMWGGVPYIRGRKC